MSPAILKPTQGRYGEKQLGLDFVTHWRESYQSMLHLLKTSISQRIMSGKGLIQQMNVHLNTSFLSTEQSLVRAFARNSPSGKSLACQRLQVLSIPFKPSSSKWNLINYPLGHRLWTDISLMKICSPIQEKCYRIAYRQTHGRRLMLRMDIEHFQGLIKVNSLACLPLY